MNKKQYEDDITIGLEYDENDNPVLYYIRHNTKTEMTLKDISGVDSFFDSLKYELGRGIKRLIEHDQRIGG